MAPRAFLDHRDGLADAALGFKEAQQHQRVAQERQVDRVLDAAHDTLSGMPVLIFSEPLKAMLARRQPTCQTRRSDERHALTGQAFGTPLEM
jgi:hypothetical protein